MDAPRRWSGGLTSLAGLDEEGPESHEAMGAISRPFQADRTVDRRPVALSGWWVLERTSGAREAGPGKGYRGDQEQNARPQSSSRATQRTIEAPPILPRQESRSGLSLTGSERQAQA